MAWGKDVPESSLVSHQGPGGVGKRSEQNRSKPFILRLPDSQTRPGSPHVPTCMRLYFVELTEASVHDSDEPISVSLGDFKKNSDSSNNNSNNG